MVSILRRSSIEAKYEIYGVQFGIALGRARYWVSLLTRFRKTWMAKWQVATTVLVVVRHGVCLNRCTAAT